MAAEYRPDMFMQSDVEDAVFQVGLVADRYHPEQHEAFIDGVMRALRKGEWQWALEPCETSNDASTAKR